MSLTSELKDPYSDVSKWFRRTCNPVAVSQFVDGVNRQLKTRHRLVASYHKNSALVGTAYDYAFRWQMQPLETDGLIAMYGAAMLREEYRTMKSILIRKMVELGNQEPGMRNQCSIGLALFELIYRSGHIPDVLHTAWEFNEPKTFLDALPYQDEVADLDLLIGATNFEKFKVNDHYIPNPTFDGSFDAGGADADLIIDNSLYDLKTSRMSAPFTDLELFQMIGYVLLDYSNKYNLEYVGWYYARRTMLLRFPVGKIISRLEEKRVAFQEVLEKMNADAIATILLPPDWGDK